MAADRLRTDLVSAGLSPLTMSPAESGQLLCSWVAYALQSLADAFVEAEERSGPPPSPGFLTAVTADQVRLIAVAVPPWIARARRAAADPGYDVAGDVPLPATLPPWVQVEPCPLSHPTGMRNAAATMFERRQLAMADFERATSSHAGVQSDMRARVAALQALLDATPGSVRGSLRAREHEAAEVALRELVNRCFELGQMLSRPRLLRGRSRPPGRTAPQPPVPRRPVADRPDSFYGHHAGYDHHGGHQRSKSRAWRSTTTSRMKPRRTVAAPQGSELSSGGAVGGHGPESRQHHEHRE